MLLVKLLRGGGLYKMDFYEVLFLVFFLVALIVFLLKVYNVVRLSSSGLLYGFPGAIISFIVYLLSWVFCAVIMFHNPSETVYVVLWQFLSWCLLVVVVLFIVEVFLVMKDAGLSGIKPYMSRGGGGGPYFPGR